MQWVYGLRFLTTSRVHRLRLQCALLERLRDIALISVDLRDLDRQALLYAAQVEEGLSDRPDVAGLVEALESVDQGDISGDDIARD